MREVYNNAMVAHIWANQSQPNARSGNGNFFFQGKAIYSYGSHFPVAVRLNADTVVFNSDSYSPTTSQHQWETRSAARHVSNRLFVNTQVMQTLVSERRLTKRDRDSIVAEAMRVAQEHCESALKRRKASLRDADYAAALSALDENLELIHILKLRPLKKLTDLRDMIANSRDELQTHFEGALKREKKRKKAAERKRQKELAKRLEEAIEVFRRGGSYGQFSAALRGDSNILIRVRGGEIETSHGASFPAEHGKKAFPFIRACRDQSKGFQRNGQCIRLGHFAIDEIDEEGNVRAGCHFVKWPEIERTAMELGVLEPA